MTNYKFKKVGAIILVTLSILGTVSFASTSEYGAKGTEEQIEYSLEDMLQYALEDEELAYAEYELIINELNADRPFTNIIRAEATHIEAVKNLYDTYDLEIPEINASEHVVLPSSIEEALATGVTAEIENIAMYEKFLAQELPDDVRYVFEALKKGSESHLQAFQVNGTRARGNGRVGTSEQRGNMRQGKGNSNINSNERLNKNQTDDCLLLN